MIKNIGVIPTIIKRRNSINLLIDCNLIIFLKKCFPRYNVLLLSDKKEARNKISLFVSSGGNSIVSLDQGDANKFRKLLDDYFFKYALKKNIPYLGICHGAQHIANYFISTIVKKKNHTKTNHLIFFKSSTRRQNVNSYHDYTITKLGKKLNTIAYTKDGSIEAFKHNNKKILGVMWHPERYKNIKKFDLQFIKKYL